MADLQVCLEFRSAALNAVLEIVPKLGPDMRLLDNLILHAQKICEHLDRSRGIRSRFWPQSPASIQGRSGQASAVHYADLLCYLRELHCFCSLQGKQFHHMADLHAASPHRNVSALLQECLAHEKGREQLQTVLAAFDQGGNDPEIDPLDKFMASIQVPETSGTIQSEVVHKQTTCLTQEVEKRKASQSGTCKKVHLTAEAAAAERRAAASALLTAQGKARKGVELC